VTFGYQLSLCPRTDENDGKNFTDFTGRRTLWMHTDFYLTVRYSGDIKKAMTKCFSLQCSSDIREHIALFAGAQSSLAFPSDNNSFKVMSMQYAV
jgi:hypothetical protein